MQATKETYHEIGTTENELLLISAVWCGPCKKIHPIIEEIEKEYPDLRVWFLDAEDDEDFVEKYKVRSIPTLIFLKYGEETLRLLGAVPKETIIKKVENLFESRV